MPVSVPRFDRHFFDGTERFTCIGDGEVGGKATGLLRIRDVLRTRIAPGEVPNFDVDVPRLTIIATGVGPSRVGDCLGFLSFTPARRVFFAGAVGGLAKGHAIGDFFVPTRSMEECLLIQR